MADFKKAYALTMGIEGGYANDPDDSGGETWKGISRNNEPNWPGWAIIDAYKKRPGFPGTLAADAELEELTQEVYKRVYWDVYGLDAANDQDISNEMFDTGVNCGTGTAARYLQRTLNVTNRNGRDYPDLQVDGKIGPKTLAALNGHPRPRQVLKVLNVLQGNRYIEICEARPVQEKFMSSWLSRVSL